MRWLSLVLAAALAACGESMRFSQWPGEADDIVLLLTAVPGEPGRFVSARSGRPVERQTLDSGESLFAIVIPRATMESVQPGIDLSASGLSQAVLRQAPSQCSVEVVSGGDAVTFPIPAESELFQLSPKSSGFEPSNISLEALITESVLSLPLGDPPCQPKSAARPFEVLGPLLSASDRGEEFRDIARLDDLLVLPTKCCINVYQRGQPAQSFIDEGLLAATQIEEVELHEGASGEITLVVGHQTKRADDSLETGGLSWWRWTGSAFEHRFSIELSERLAGLAVASDGRVAIVAGESTLYMGTVTSSVVQTLNLTGVVELSHVAFAPSGELVIATEGSVEKVDINAQTVFDGVELVDVARVSANSPVRNLGFVGDDVYAATHSRGVYKVRLGGHETVQRLEIAIARPNTLCSEFRSCLGSDFSDSNESLALANGPAPKVVLVSSNCAVMTIFDPQTGCATDLPTVQRRAVVHAGPQFLTVAEVTGLSEFFLSDLVEP